MQHAYAISDALAGTWTASTGSDLFEMINEVYPPVDTDYIISAASPDNDTCAVNLTALNTPVDGTVTMRVRAKWAS